MAEVLPPLCTIGSVVSELSKIGVSGTVLMSFEHCAYLQFNQQLLCFGLHELGASPITGLFDQGISLLPHNFVVGTTAKLCARGLLVDDQHLFELSSASLYVSSLSDYMQKFGAPHLQSALLSELSIPNNGLGPFLRILSEAATITDLTNTVFTGGSNTTLVNYVRPAIEQLTDQLCAHCLAAVDGVTNTVPCTFESASFRQLLGAGPGLTPSGDDFICGVFTALHLSGFADVAQSLWASIETIVAESTTPVSSALMAQSAAGESSERLDALMNAYGNYPVTPANEFERLVEQIGETSGWDWITGFVWCAYSATHRRRPLLNTQN